MADSSHDSVAHFSYKSGSVHGILLLSITSPAFHRRRHSSGVSIFTSLAGIGYSSSSTRYPKSSGGQCRDFPYAAAIQHVSCQSSSGYQPSLALRSISNPALHIRIASALSLQITIFDPLTSNPCCYSSVIRRRFASILSSRSVLPSLCSASGILCCPGVYDGSSTATISNWGSAACRNSGANRWM